MSDNHLLLRSISESSVTSTSSNALSNTNEATLISQGVDLLVEQTLTTDASELSNTNETALLGHQATINASTASTAIDSTTIATLNQAMKEMAEIGAQHQIQVRKGLVTGHTPFSMMAEMQDLTGKESLISNSLNVNVSAPTTFRVRDHQSQSEVFLSTDISGDEGLQILVTGFNGDTGLVDTDLVTLDGVDSSTVVSSTKDTFSNIIEMHVVTNTRNTRPVVCSFDFLQFERACAIGSGDVRGKTSIIQVPLGKTLFLTSGRVFSTASNNNEAIEVKGYIIPNDAVSQRYVSSRIIMVQSGEQMISFEGLDGIPERTVLYFTANLVGGGVGPEGVHININGMLVDT